MNRDAFARIAVIAALVWVLGAFGSGAFAQTLEGKLVHVRDADTIELATSRGRIAIRLNGVDAPELDERGGRAGREWMRRAFGGQQLTCRLNGDRSYLTWRDSKAALVMFNTKNKDFSKILTAVPETLHNHPLFIRELECREAGEWRVQMRSEEDAGRRVIVQVFAFDLYAPTTGA